jgi:carboxypeptidase T
MKRTLFPLVVAMLCATFLLAQERWSKVRIQVPDAATFIRLVQLGVEFEGSHGKPGGSIECTVSSDALTRLRSEGIVPEVVIEDLAAYYASRLEPGAVNALGFGYGSMGGYYTVSEIGQQLDSLRQVHPGVVGTRDSIGRSLQGRPIWAVRITADPDIASNRPQVLYFALQHPREPMGMMTLLYFMWYLAEQYGQDPEVTYLLQNRDLWFIPIVNVDGYEANRRMAPGGGGMRYKNMRNVVTDDDQNGVNLNNNWGAEWGYDDIGSSPDPLHPRYRGTAPFSEPETQAVRNFYRGKSFRFVMEFHAYYNDVLYAPGYTVHENADSLLLRAYARELTRVNHYANGSSTAMYLINGYSSDWLYENPPSLGPSYPFLVEVGSLNDGDWPPTSRILPLASQNTDMNLFSAWAGGANDRLESASLQDSSGEGDLESGESFILNLRVRNFGQEPSSATSIVVSSQSLLMASSSINLASLAPNRDTLIAVQGRVPTAASDGTRASIVVISKPGGDIEKRDTVVCVIGHGAVVFADGAEQGSSKWSLVGGWGLTPVAHAGQRSFTESPSGNYRNYENAVMTLLSPVHIPDTAGITQLRFWSRWDTEACYDFGQVSITSNQGESWNVLHGDHASLIDGYQYTGCQAEWIEERIDLHTYIGKDVFLKFSFTSDDSYNGDGWYLDDIAIRQWPAVKDGVISEHSLPTVCTLEQNYPNPFNPSTSIKYTVGGAGNQGPGVSKIRLAVYDLLGREVKVLVDERKAPGSYEVQFDASGLSSGVYFYRLTAGNFVQGRKMIVLK